MKIDVVTIFPQIFVSFQKEGMVRIAIENKLLEVNIYDLRDYTEDKHRKVDDKPYGGGPGMVMKIEPFYKAVTSILQCSFDKIREKALVVLLSPQGQLLNTELLQNMAHRKHLLLLCGRYEGVDERVAESIAEMEISIGDYVLSGGEIPAMVLIEGIARLIPGVLGDDISVKNDSFSQGLLEYPQYTRPEEFLGSKVPEVLVSGNHQEIEKWRKKQALKRTKIRRPDLFDKKQK